MRWIVKILINAVSVVLGAYLLPGVAVDSPWTAVMVAVVLALLNAIVRPLLIFLTLPATIVTLGLFLLVINAAIILIADKLVGGFAVDSFWWALLFSIILWAINTVLNRLMPGKEDEDDKPGQVKVFQDGRRIK